MAAYLDETNGKVSLAFIAGTPIWHGTGNEITREELEGLTEAQVVELWISRAGLPDLKTARVLWLPEGGDSLQGMGNRKVIYRPDTLAALSVMGEGYKVHQPKEMFAAFNRICHAAGLEMETAGLLGGSKKMWCQGASGLAMSVGGEKHVWRIVLAGSCDGSMASTAKQTGTCVVCSNTFEMAFNEDGTAVKQFHTKEFDEQRMLQAVLEMDQEKQAAEYETQMNSLAAEPMDLVRAEDFFSDLLRPRTEAQKAADLEAERAGEKIKRPRGLDKLLDAFTSAPGAAPKSALGLVQAATFYIDNQRNQDNPDARLNSALFGQGATFKQKAFAQAKELVAA